MGRREELEEDVNVEEDVVAHSHWKRKSLHAAKVSLEIGQTGGYYGSPECEP